MERACFDSENDVLDAFFYPRKNPTPQAARYPLTRRMREARNAMIRQQSLDGRVTVRGVAALLGVTSMGSADRLIGCVEAREGPGSIDNVVARAPDGAPLKLVLLPGMAAPWENGDG
jgi:hypothetical protein